MGAWTFMSDRLRDLVDGRIPVRYIGRPEQASPAEGFADLHQMAQRFIIEAAFAATLPEDVDTARENEASTNGTATNGTSKESAKASAKKKVTASSAD
jgi:2-oxoglutarate dehydrogenase E1 component